MTNFWLTILSFPYVSIRDVQSPNGGRSFGYLHVGYPGTSIGSFFGAHRIPKLEKIQLASSPRKLRHNQIRAHSNNQ